MKIITTYYMLFYSNLKVRITYIHIDPDIDHSIYKYDIIMLHCI